MNNKYFVIVISAVFDFLAAAVSVLLSFYLTVSNPIYFDKNIFLFTIITWPLIIAFLFYILKIYNILWRFSRLTEFLRILIALFVSTAIVVVCQMAIFNRYFGINTTIINLFFTFLFIFIYRLILRKIIKKINSKNKFSDNSSQIKRTVFGNTMIIGAGSAASMIINEVSSNFRFSGSKIKCIIDDDRSKHGAYISGIKVVGDCTTIIEMAEKYKIQTILFAIPSCSNARKSEILNICQQTNCELKIVPSLYQIISNEYLTPTIREVEIEDLLGREPIEFDIEKVINYVSNKTILVTGGGGSIGSELCRQIAEHNPRKLIIFDIYENNAYEIQNELVRKHPELDIVALVGSVRDSKRIESVFKEYKPEIVYHAAAHKHVPLMESSPNESIKNNVFGTLKTATCADKYGAQRFILISTDKAVNPTNIMGASKRICEMIVQSFNNRSDTEFVAVRFGNVLGSNGSVIPLFKQQIAAGGPITVTHPDIIRYFMTIPEAVRLVLQAGASAKGGEIFVLDMGKPVKILTLAENLIKLSGLTPYKDIKIEFVGLRPGEKLFEELLMSEEGLIGTENSLIHIGKPIEFDEDFLFKTLDIMYEKMYDDNVDIRALVKSIVPTYNYNKNNLKEKDLLTK